LSGCPLGSAGDADPACAAQCPKDSTSTEGQQAIAGLDSCRTSAASSSCPMCDDPVLYQSCPKPPTHTSLCGKCEDERCCQTEAACQADADCVALLKCTGTCSMPACFQTCLMQNPKGGDLFGALFACRVVQCEADAYCDPSFRTACNACNFGTCGDAYARLLSIPGGWAYVVCGEVCAGDMTCVGNCTKTSGVAVAAFAVTTCVTDYNCASLCP
jgi:hypothetical protein